MQSVVVGLAAAFVVVLVQPQLLPAIDGGRSIGDRPPASYADAVDISAPAVASVYTRRVVADEDAADGSGRFRVNTGVGSAVVIDADGYLVTNYHVVVDADELAADSAGSFGSITHGRHCARNWQSVRTDQNSHTRDSKCYRAWSAGTGYFREFHPD